MKKNPIFERFKIHTKLVNFPDKSVSGIIVFRSGMLLGAAAAFVSLMEVERDLQKQGEFTLKKIRALEQEFLLLGKKEVEMLKERLEE